MANDNTTEKGLICEMETISYKSLLIISLLAFATPIFLSSFKKIKIPYVVGEILVGLIVGKSFLNLIEHDIWIIFLSSLGLAYLMFLSGLEINVEELFARDGQGSIRFYKGAFMFLASLLICFIMVVTLDYFGIISNTLFFTILFASSAPGLLVPVLKERDLLSTDFGQLLLVYCLIAEFVCLISITIISSTVAGGFSYKNFLFIIVLLASIALYFLSKGFIKVFDLNAVEFKNLHIEVRAAFALILVLSALSHAVKSEIVLGSFLAGLIFSLIFHKAKEDLKYKLDTIGYGFLIPIFFIQVGVNLDVKSIYENPKALALIPLLLIIFYIAKFPASLILWKTFGFNKALSSSFILSSQLSLMIVGSQIGYNLKIMDTSTYSIFIITTIVSCLLFPILFDKTFNSEGVVKKKTSSLNKISIRETVVNNESLYNKSLKEIKFPEGCRILLLIRNDEEIIPTGNTILQNGDILLLAGVKEFESEMLHLINESI